MLRLLTTIFVLLSLLGPVAAGADEPSLKFTVRVPPPAAASTTWLLVRM